MNRAVALLLGLTACGGRDVLPPADGSLSETDLVDSVSDAGTEASIDVADPCMAVFCLTSNGECVKSTETACGGFGDPCEVCDVDAGYFCKGACYRPQPNCNSANCAGCCASNGYCSTGIHDIACGNAGLPCDRCVPSEGTGQCIPHDGGGGVCSKTPICSPTTCQNGCCIGNVCAVGTQDIACGSGGAACENCTFLFKETCIAQKCTGGG